MNIEKLSGIVVYTIHDKDELREALRNALVEQMHAEYLDESTYGVPINGCITSEVVCNLGNFCKSAEAKAGVKFDSSDFVTLYYPNLFTSPKNEAFIKRVIIV